MDAEQFDVNKALEDDINAKNQVVIDAAAVEDDGSVPFFESFYTDLEDEVRAVRLAGRQARSRHMTTIAGDLERSAARLNELCVSLRAVLNAQ